MANNENLIPQAHKLTVEEASRGGKKSAEVRKGKSSLKKAVQWLLDSDIKISDTGNIGKKLKKEGIDVSSLNATQLSAIGLWYGALQGNAVNFKTLMEANEEVEGTIETKEPTLNINITTGEDLKEEFYKDDE